MRFANELKVSRHRHCQYCLNVLPGLEDDENGGDEAQEGEEGEEDEEYEVYEEDELHRASTVAAASHICDACLHGHLVSLDEVVALCKDMLAFVTRNKAANVKNISLGGWYGGFMAYSMKELLEYVLYALTEMYLSKPIRARPSVYPGIV